MGVHVSFLDGVHPKRLVKKVGESCFFIRFFLSPSFHNLLGHGSQLFGPWRLVVNHRSHWNS